MPDTHVTPSVGSDQRTHVLDRTCWCKPSVPRHSHDGLVIHKAEEVQLIDGDVSG